jgi:hypothetical protein
MTSRTGVVTVIAVLMIALAAACADHTPQSRSSKAIPPTVARELDAIREIAQATHAEYERLYSTVVYSTDEKKEAAAKWYRQKELSWLTYQVEDLRVRRLGLPESRLDMLLFVESGNSFIEAKPSVFVATTYYPRVSERELVSVAKLKTLRQDYESAQLRLAKALLEVEQAAADSSAR